MEIWKTIEGFEDYQVSNNGRVKSLKWGKEKILRQGTDTNGYYIVVLSCKTKKIVKTKKIHQLVSIAFLNHKPCGMELVVNHKDFNKLNNNVDNLEIVTNRENSNKKHLKSSSIYTGVYFENRSNKWVSQIAINGKKKHLGLFLSEIEASNAYQNKLKQL